ncbi:amidohydrolase [Ruminiclostridium cellulolyticum]|uniref:Amidohydrolase n=1 Tax=Ruminiclostridium cellulolyticum (strain ATCC 35319 / DSM 5812 / JCM 6584 / H10) TaxID=394503 RepID=B8I9C5_RUMCH|nr:amidohydrolase [Ruminiclostridium cellulolyticum]ACL75385.1 amidohydrolase [Ruminiclostridium cellulolyticum H10]
MLSILDKAKSIEEYIVNFRRSLHKEPELSGQEFKTQEKIMVELDKLGIDYRKAGNSSLIAELKGGKSGKTIALRGDIDALPIQEETDIEFKSVIPGVMHACGHDAHAAMLLGAAKILSEMKDELSGEVRFFFQEEEETFSGAKRIIEAGGMDGVDACFGMHVLPVIETGNVNVVSGYRLSGCDTIYVKFQGISGHGSAPHLAKDTIHPACIFVTDLQGIITKNVNPQEPVILSVGKFNGGTKANIISKYTDIDISMRYFNTNVRKIVHEAIKRHAKAIADAYEIKVEVIIEESTLSLYNDEDLSVLAEKSATKVFGEGHILPVSKQMASEDMSYYFEKAKGVYAILGYKNEDKGCIYPPHHEKFKLDEDCLKYGTALHVQFALDFLNN